jgi:hypothetical protein
MNAIMAGALMALTITAPATAADSRGMMTGGGVGAVGCPEFLNAMATARQHGGARAVAGVKGLDAFIHYVLGFQTGFNSEAEGVYDIFETLGGDAFTVLYAIEPWCAQNPDKKFSTALLVLAYSLRSKAKAH